MEKKVVSKSLAIALGVICVILTVILLVSIANYTSIINEKNKEIDFLKSQINSLNSQVANLQNRINEKNAQIESLQNQVFRLDAQIASLINQVNELNAIINLQKSVTWVKEETVSQPANSYVYWRFSANYAGYITVIVHSSTTTNTYVRVIWSAYGVNYDNTVTVGVSGSAVFPVLPCSNIEVRVGNTNIFSGATETVTIKYTY